MENEYEDWGEGYFSALILNLIQRLERFSLLYKFKLQLN